MIPINNMYDFFGDLPPELHAAFDEVSQYREADAGETLLRAGNVCTQLYQLRAGKVEYRSTDAQGNEMVAATMAKYDWIGLPELYSGMPAMADVIAITPLRLRVVQHRDFEALVERHPLVARRLLRLFSLRYTAMYHQARDRHALPLKARLLKTLYMLAVSHGKTMRQQQEILIEMPQEELSRLLAAARQNLNRQLKALERDGLIRVNYGSITVLGMQRLAERQMRAG